MASTMETAPPSPLLVISGASGTGKTTVALAWSQLTGARIVDLDEETVDIVRDERIAHADLSEADAVRRSRDRRYARLVDVVRSARTTETRGVVAVAPFSSEIASVRAWQDFVRRCGAGEVALIWLSVPPRVRAARIAERGAARDGARVDLDATFPPPVVEHLAVDARISVEHQLDVLRSHFHNGPFI